MMQMIDCSILDVQTLQFPHKILVLGFMYLILGNFNSILRQKLQVMVCEKNRGWVPSNFPLFGSAGWGVQLV